MELHGHDPSAAFETIAGDLTRLDDWEDRYRYVVALGRLLPRLTERERTNANKVHGCASQVWLVGNAAYCNGQLVLSFRGESDATIVQGMMAVLLSIYSGRPVSVIAETDARPLLASLGFYEHLTVQRSNGLMAVAKLIRTEAKAHLVHPSGPVAITFSDNRDHLTTG